MLILKFGGSSVGNPKTITQVKKIISGYKKNNEIVVVVSAFKGVTDSLIELGTLAQQRNNTYKENFLELKKRHLDTVKKLGIKNKSITKEITLELTELAEILQGVYITQELTPKILDSIMSLGERLSAQIIAEYVPGGKYIDARKLVKTDNTYGNAKVNLAETYKNIQTNLKYKNKVVPIVTGFLGSTENGETTTIGRNGSDYTASIFGAALKATAVEIWTDVDGLLTADPNKIKNVHSLDAITYDEVFEVARMGAKVVHPYSITPLVWEGIPIFIKNTFNPEFVGTKISNSNEISKFNVISSMSGLSLVEIKVDSNTSLNEISSLSLNVIKKIGGEVILVNQYELSDTLKILVKIANPEKLSEQLNYEFRNLFILKDVQEIYVENGKSLISVLCTHSLGAVTITKNIFTCLEELNIESDLLINNPTKKSVGVLVNTPVETKVINFLHSKLLEDVGL